MGAVEARAGAVADLCDRPQRRRPYWSSGPRLSSRRARPIPLVPLPRRLRARVRVHGCGDRRRRPPERPTRRIPRASTAALAGHAFLCRLSLALARLHAYAAGPRRLHRRLGTAWITARSYVSSGGDFIPARREAGEVRRARKGVADVPRWTWPPALGRWASVGRSAQRSRDLRHRTRSFRHRLRAAGAARVPFGGVGPHRLPRW